MPQKVETRQIKPAPDSANSAYEEIYSKEFELTITGLFLSVVWSLLAIKDNTFIKGDFEWYYFIIYHFAMRIFCTAWVVRVANRQNRNTIGWGLLTFILPPLAMILIGIILKRQSIRIKLDRRLPKNQQVSVLFGKADKLFLDNRYLECVEILDLALQIENDNSDCKKLRGFANFNIKNYEKAKWDFETLIEKGEYRSIGQILFGNDYNYECPPKTRLSENIESDYTIESKSSTNTNRSGFNYEKRKRNKYTHIVKKNRKKKTLTY